MKRIVAILLLCCVLFSINTIDGYAADLKNENELMQDEKIIEIARGLNDSTDRKGLILANTLSLAKSSGKLSIAATTICHDDVTKCGFTYIKLQRLVSGSWTDYATYCYYDQYVNLTQMVFGKNVTPPTGYSYRVVCEHYAEKPRLIFFKDTETIYNVTTTVTF